MTPYPTAFRRGYMKAHLWAALVALSMVLAPGCSRPPQPHPEAVAPAADDEPTVCHGPDCAVPGVK